jgi:hypothetical protein
VERSELTSSLTSSYWIFRTLGKQIPGKRPRCDDSAFRNSCTSRLDSMTINLPLSKISSPAFIGGFRTLRQSRFGTAAAWAIYRMGEQIDRELERYFLVRKEIEDRFAQANSNGRIIPKESVPSFERELEELGKKEIELSLDHRIRLPADCLIEPDQIGALVEAGILEMPHEGSAEEGRRSAAEPSSNNKVTTQLGT